MRVASWNVNSIRVRLPRVLEWLERESPDLLLLQEIKCQSETFPTEGWKEIGYPYHRVVGQKGYNGVAVISKRELSDCQEVLPGFEDQARYIGVTVSGIRVIGIYAPNGNPVGSAGYWNKLAWFEGLTAHLFDLLQAERAFIVGGDFNIIPTPEDVYDPAEWEQDALFVPEVRAFFRRLLYLGLTDGYRIQSAPKGTPYTFWAYQRRSWEFDHGLRIDHFLLSPQATDRFVDCTIDREPRGLAKASDHVPIILRLG